MTTDRSTITILRADFRQLVVALVEIEDLATEGNTFGARRVALEHIRKIARNAQVPGSKPPPAGVAGYPIGTRHAGVVAVQQPGRGAS